MSMAFFSPLFGLCESRKFKKEHLFIFLSSMLCKISLRVTMFFFRSLLITGASKFLQDCNNLHKSLIEASNGFCLQRTFSLLNGKYCLQIHSNSRRAFLRFTVFARYSSDRDHFQTTRIALYATLRRKSTTIIMLAAFVCLFSSSFSKHRCSCREKFEM